MESTLCRSSVSQARPIPPAPPSTGEVDIDQALQDVLNKSGIDAARLALGVEGLQGFVNPADHGFEPGNIAVAGSGGFQEFLLAG